MIGGGFYDTDHVMKKKHTTRKCCDCKFYHDGRCWIFNARTSPVSPRCDECYEPRFRWWERLVNWIEWKLRG